MAEEAQGLSNWRRRASEASRGVSEDAIHDVLVARLVALGAHGDLLDFGAGTGTLTRRLLGLQRFGSVSAADLMPAPTGLPDAVAWRSQDLNAPLDAPAASFDVLVACEVVEHLENPRALAREWHRLLRPGGLLLMSTPNNESVRSLVALLVRGHFVAFGDGCYPAHITALLRKDVERILAEAGFVDIRVAYTDLGGVPGWPSLQWQRLSFGLLRGVRWSDGLVAWARKASAPV